MDSQNRNNPSSHRDSASITIWLSRWTSTEAVDNWKVDRVITQSQSFMDTVRINTDDTADKVIHRSLWQAMCAYLPKEQKRVSVLSSDFELHLPGVSLGALTVSGQSGSEGRQSVMFRFRRVIGASLAIFSRAHRPSMTQDMECGLSTRVLDDLIAPVLNLLSILEVEGSKLHADKISACLDNLRAHRRDIEFFRTLIVRYIDQQDTLAQSDPQWPAYRYLPVCDSTCGNRNVAIGPASKEAIV